MIKPEQSRAARGLLGWSQQDLADATSISKTSIVNFERGQTGPKADMLHRIRQAYEDASIEFPDEYGVRIRRDHVEIFKGDDALRKLWDDIFATLKVNGGEVLITNVDEKRTEDVEKQALHAHLERLKKYNIKERLLSCQGDTYFLMPQEYYRWISKELFTYGLSSYIYEGKVAIQLWGSSIITLIHSQDAHDAEKRRFEDLWKRARIPPRKL